MQFDLLAPCRFGLEKILSFEVKRAGGENIRITDGRVWFTGDERVIARANLTCSVAERVGIVLAHFKAKTFDDVFFTVQDIPFEQYAEKNAKFPVTKGRTVSSALTSIPALQRTVKKALSLRMQKAYNMAALPETGRLYPVHFLLMKDEMTLLLDTSGDSLHKRGYRALSGDAPISETLAAGLCDLARVRDRDTVIDPFCGSGTILIEAVYKALNIPPCLKRDFISMQFGFIPQNVWQEEKERATSEIRTAPEFHIYGYDMDEEVLKIARENIKKAGVDSYITLERRTLSDYKPLNAPVKIITNPPYAKRMGEEKEVKALYQEMGRIIPPRENQELYIITPFEDFEALYGYKADKNRRLYNGMLPCRLYQYFKKDKPN
jgi:putative N6-adenine-specific DNA methylase